MSRSQLPLKRLDFWARGGLSKLFDVVVEVVLADPLECHTHTTETNRRGKEPFCNSVEQQGCVEWCQPRRLSRLFPSLLLPAAVSPRSGARVH